MSTYVYIEVYLSRIDVDRHDTRCVAKPAWVKETKTSYVLQELLAGRMNFVSMCPSAQESNMCIDSAVYIQRHVYIYIYATPPPIDLGFWVCCQK